ncbi:MAG TPA: hypothetical protein VLA93_20005 [Pyrinomonadaceae bacterium]|nr:hypothetical protein [Pyrinomonadaceae bacterium]
MNTLDGWGNFYLIVGGSAGALIGLQFVVLTLIAQTPLPKRMAQAGAAFATPSVVHFAVVLLLSAILSAPWHAIGIVSLFWGLVGLAGLTYAVITARRLQIQTVYRPVFEDWLFHAALPLTAYAMLTTAAIVVRSYTRASLFAVGASTLVLQFTAISRGRRTAFDAYLSGAVG